MSERDSVERVHFFSIALTLHHNYVALHYSLSATYVLILCGVFCVEIFKININQPENKKKQNEPNDKGNVLFGLLATGRAGKYACNSLRIENASVRPFPV